MEATLLESANDKNAVALFEVLLRCQEDREECVFPDCVFSLAGELHRAEQENYPLYKVLMSAPDDQAQLAIAFADGFMRGWNYGRMFRRRRHMRMRRRSP